LTKDSYQLVEVSRAFTEYNGLLHGCRAILVLSLINNILLRARKNFSTTLL